MVVFSYSLYAIANTYINPPFPRVVANQIVFNYTKSKLIAGKIKWKTTKRATADICRLTNRQFLTILVKVTLLKRVFISYKYWWY